MAADGLAPGGGSAAAITIAFAAKLTAMVANCSRATWEDAPGVVAQAAAIADRAAALARMDAAAWEAALTALRDAEAGSVDDRRRDFRLQQKLDAAAAVPLEIAALGADAAALAALAGERGDATYRADAAVAASLAAGAARATAYLVRVNLGVHGSDSRLARARASEAAAAEAAESLLDASL